jgi:hypothetical protein
MKTNYMNQMSFTFFFVLAIENQQKLLLFKILKFSFWQYIASKKG